jgi:hypothetical protein
MERNAREKAASTEHMVDYDRNSYMQDQMVRSRAEWLRAAVEHIGPVAPEFTVMDYGCGPGHSALAAVMPAIEAYRQIDPRGTIVVRHSDHAGNDWGALMALVFGADGYQRNGSNIRTEVVAGSFYTQLAPPRSVALGVCFAASHWLSRAPAPYSPGTAWFADLKGEARAEFAALARADWTQFLRCRAKELRPGGIAIVSTLGSIPMKARSTASDRRPENSTAPFFRWRTRWSPKACSNDRPLTISCFPSGFRQPTKHARR